MSYFDYPKGASGKGEANASEFLSEWGEVKWKKFMNYSHHRRFECGDTIIQIGDTDRSLQIILSGELHVLVPTRRPSRKKVIASIV